MGKTFFYARLAAANLNKNRQFCLPYLLTGAVCTMMLYLMRYLTYSELVRDIRGADYVGVVMGLGSLVIAVTAFFILWYANRFVMRRREKELGLYNILGMEKRQTAAVLAFESLYLGLAGIVSGLCAGILFSKLTLLALLRLLRFAVPLGFTVSLKGLAEAAVLMAVLYAVLLAANWVRLSRLKPVELLHSGAVGEREPKSRRLLAAFGAVCLLGGYGIALAVKSPLSALLLFFAAVVLVIIGTHCLFSAGSVVLLKRLRAHTGFYYRPRNFTAVSGLLYRMKQNARGLSNICILATMVLVTVSTTLCMYAGSDYTLGRLYPYPAAYHVMLPEDQFDADFTPVEQAVEKLGICGDGQKAVGYRRLVFTAGQDKSGRYTIGSSVISGDRIPTFEFLTAADYGRLTGRTVRLAQDEVLACGPAGGDTFTVGGSTFAVRERLDGFPVVCDGFLASQYELTYFVVADTGVLRSLFELQKAAQSGHGYSMPLWCLDLPLAGDSAAQLENGGRAAQTIQTELAAHVPGATLFNYDIRAQISDEYYATNGGFLFLGLFLGLLFLLATVLIIYYKQLSEGYEDRQRFEILQKVGMSRREVRGTIRTQVLLMFFLPLALAAVHIGMAFPMLERLLTLFSLDNTGLFAACTAATFLVFTLVYVAVYTATARKYAAIVQA